MASDRQRSEVLRYGDARWKSEHHEGGRSRQVQSREPRDDPMYGRGTDDTRRIQHHDRCDRSKQKRTSGATPAQDGLRLYQHVKGLSTCHGTSDLAKQGR